MTIRKIIPKSEVSLKPSRPVTDFNDQFVKQSIQDLLDSLANIQAEHDKTRPEMSGGVGLAANQIEYPEDVYPKDFVPFNIYVVNVRALRAEKEKCEEVKPSVYINAKFAAVPDANDQLVTSEYTEGCLSLKGIFSPKLPRSENIVLTYFDEEGKPQTLNAEGFVARVHQHELDHGLGKEFLNHLDFTEIELYAIFKWLGTTTEPKVGDYILPDKLYVAYLPADFEALASWVTHEIKKKLPLQMIRVSTDMFSSSGNNLPSITPNSPPGEDETIGVERLGLR
jgi:peptide deformylase